VLSTGEHLPCRVVSFGIRHDANGNTTSKTDSTGTTNYSWDFNNRLTSVTLPGSGGTVTFRYDPSGRRIYKSSSSGTSIFVYDGDNLIEETNGSGAVVARYTQGANIDEPLAMLRSSATSYYHADGLGSVTSLSNAAGALAQTYTYDSFGKVTASSGSVMNPLQYTAREFDTETNLQFSRARYYDSNAGRFVSEDPVRFNGSANFYRYTDNNPVSFSDPLGLKTCALAGSFDLYSSITKENYRYSPWVLGQGGTMSGSRGPWEGGASSNTPPGVNPRGGLPGITINRCMWSRTMTYDLVKTTYSIEKYICWDETPCGGVAIWLELRFGKRRDVVGTGSWPDTSVRTYDWLGLDFESTKHCEALGP
jgi:RHS repeat-associated protein